MRSTKTPLKIVHFNDVYDVTEDSKSYICGGVARFASKIKQIKDKDPSSIVLFSGDLWSPSRRTDISDCRHNPLQGRANSGSYKRMFNRRGLSGEPRSSKS